MNEQEQDIMEKMAARIAKHPDLFEYVSVWRDCKKCVMQAKTINAEVITLIHHANDGELWRVKLEEFCAFTRNEFCDETAALRLLEVTLEAWSKGEKAVVHV